MQNIIPTKCIKVEGGASGNIDTIRCLATLRFDRKFASRLKKIKKDMSCFRNMQAHRINLERRQSPTDQDQDAPISGVCTLSEPIHGFQDFIQIPLLVLNVLPASYSFICHINSDSASAGSALSYVLLDASMPRLANARLSCTKSCGICYSEYPQGQASHLESASLIGRAHPTHQPLSHPALRPPSATFSQHTASFTTTTSWTQSTGDPSPPSSSIDDNCLPSTLDQSHPRFLCN
ncbi:hypothetical protein K439DRAFT_1567686 [Ramaria rubella]|nr:hypothetical protein K439DRAFT_1567686 [Ramaria rubella]